MARYESWFAQDLKKPVQVQMIKGNLFSADVQSNLVGVRVFDDGETATLSGTVSANIIRPDGGTVAATGTLSGNECSVVLPAAAYAYPGVATIVIKLTDSGVVTTLLAVVVTIYRTSTDTAVDPGTIIPSIQTLLDQIDAAIASVDAAIASIPADYSSLWTTLAPAYTSLTFPVKAGQYCTNGGVFYRAKQDIATSEEFTSSHWDTANIGNELSSLKSALDDLQNITVEADGESTTETVSYTTSVGYMMKSGSVETGGSYDQYRYTSKISVNPGDVISFTFSSSASARVITAFSGNTAVSASGAENVTGTYAVPDGINGIVVTFYSGGILAIKRTYTTYTYHVKGMPDIEGRVSDLEADQSELSNQVDYIKHLVISDEQLSETENCYYTTSTGYMYKSGSVETGGSYDQYRYTSKISVNPGDVISFTFSSSASARVITAFSGNTAVSASGAENVTGTYAVPDGINGIVVTFYSGGINGIKKTIYYTYTTLKNQPGTSGLIYRFNISSNNYAGIENLQDMTNYSMQFRGDVSTFNGLIVAHGYNEYMGGYVKVTVADAEHIDFAYYLGTEANPRYTEQIAMVIKDYIAIQIDVAFGIANFYIATNGSVYTKAGQTWDVRKGALAVRSVGTNVLANCALSYNAKGWSKPVHMYGDSYFGIYTDKWTYYLKNDGSQDFNLNGYPGRNSATAIENARIVLNKSFPKKIVWCLGMNDPDNISTWEGEVNPSWKECVDKLIQTCETRNIELILATIPNVPTVDNTYKNAYVRASGKRYIDFANAVGASNDTTWYDGMLSNDGVHPSVQGAIALFNQAIADVPELMQ